jgi:hypothetical protein
MATTCSKLGVQHDGTVNIANRPVRCALEDSHRASEVEHYPEHNDADSPRHALPAIRAIRQRRAHNQRNGNKNFLKVHNAIFAADGGGTYAGSA